MLLELLDSRRLILVLGDNPLLDEAAPPALP